MIQKLTYNHTPVKDISRTLASLFGAAPSGNESLIYRAPGANLLIIVPENTDLSQIDLTVNILASSHPGRIFILIKNEELSELKAETSACCNIISKNETSCSEILRVSFSSKIQRAVPSIIRANLLTGVNTEIYLFGQSLDLALTEAFAGHTEVIIFDSNSFVNNLSSLLPLFDLPCEIVDLQWITLKPWQEELASGYERFLTGLPSKMLKEIQIYSSDLKLLQPFLFAGWILESLGVTEVKKQNDTFVLSSFRFGDICLSFAEEKNETFYGLVACKFIFNGLFRPSNSVSGHIELKRDESILHTSVKLENNGIRCDCFSLNRKLENLDSALLFKRHLQGRQIAVGCQNALRHALGIMHGLKNK